VDLLNRGDDYQGWWFVMHATGDSVDYVIALAADRDVLMAVMDNGGA
jgi:hypothetical protein